MSAMPLWRKLWLLFSVLWVVICALSALTLIAAGEPGGLEKVWTPVALAIGVPPLAYLFAWGVSALRRRAGRED